MALALPPFMRWVLVVLVPSLLATFVAARVVFVFAGIYFPERVAKVVEAAPTPAALGEAPGPAPVREPVHAPVVVPATRCAIASRVVVLVADEAAPRESMAVLTWPGATGFDRPLVHTGTQLGDHRVAAITATRVWLERAGRTCFVDGSTERPVAPVPKPIVTASAGIDRVDDSHAKIDRLTRDALLDKGAAALGNVRIAPDVVSGKVVGMKVLAIPEASVLSKLGLRAGDSIVSINGFDVTTPEGALEAMARLRAAPSLELSIRRNGAPTALRVDVI